VTPLDEATVRRKLSRIVSDLSRLTPLARLDESAWSADADRRDVGERRLQTCIEAAIDINAHLLVSHGHPAPADAYQSFHDLASRTGILAPELARDLAPSAGLRNRLVHQYDILDDARVLVGLRAAVELYPKFVEAVSAHLDRPGDADP
jgi:uncharacterized protein YutE (UPF0331/DUF86 family)